MARVGDFRLLVQFCRDPFQVFAEVSAREQGKRSVSLFGRRIHFLTRHAEAQNILKKETHFHKSGFVFRQIRALTGDNGMVQLPQAQALQLRAELASTLSPQKLRQLRPAFRENFSRVFSAVPGEADHFNLTSALQGLVFRNALSYLIGDDHENWLPLFPIFQELNEVCGERIRSPFGLLGLDFRDSARARRLGRELREKIREALKESDLASDSVAGLLRSRDEAFVLSQLQTLLFAGYETTASSLLFSCDALSRNPGAQREIYAEAAVQADPDRYLNRVSYQHYLKALRDQPPTWTLARNCVADEASLGYLKGDLIFIGVREAQREQPISVDALLAFGGGARICFGLRLALFEAAVVLESLFSQFSLKNEQVFPIAPRATITAQPDRPLFVTLSRLIEVAHAV